MGDGNIFYLSGGGGGGYTDVYIKIHVTIHLNKPGFKKWESYGVREENSDKSGWAICEKKFPFLFWLLSQRADIEIFIIE